MSWATIGYARLSLANVESTKGHIELTIYALGNQRRARLLGGSSGSCFGLGAPLAFALLAAFALTLAFGMARGAAFGFADAAAFGVNGLAPDFGLRRR